MADNEGEEEPAKPEDYTFTPAYKGGQFPKAATINMKRMKRAPYALVDPIEFGRRFGAFNREEITKNFEQGKTIGLEAVETELKSLLEYVPKSAQLHRETVAADNFFNQQQRTQQVNQAIPDVVADLNQVRDNARALAEGRLPDGAQDSALELGIRSRAADAAATSGFGASSSVARKASDLMSAAERLNIAQYGNQLLSSNAGMRADLLLAPTQYSTAGSQVQVMPKASAGQLAVDAMKDINQNTLVNPSTAFTSVINQAQFATNLIQNTREFNKTMKYNTKTFNASQQNQFALAKFNYEAMYAAQAAGAAASGAATAASINANREAIAIFNAERDAAADAQAEQDMWSLFGSAAGFIAGVL